MPAILDRIFNKRKRRGIGDDVAAHLVEKIAAHDRDRIRWQLEKAELQRKLNNEKEKTERLEREKSQLEGEYSEVKKKLYRKTRWQSEWAKADGNDENDALLRLQKGLDEEREKAKYLEEWSKSLLARLTNSESNLKFERLKNGKLKASNDGLMVERDSLKEQLAVVNEEFRVVRLKVRGLRVEAQKQLDGQGATTAAIPECQVCWMEYTEDDERVPRVLGCGHSACHRCASELTKDLCIRCPFCRKKTCLKTTRGVRKLPKNFALAEVVENLIDPQLIVS